MTNPTFSPDEEALLGARLLPWLLWLDLRRACTVELRSAWPLGRRRWKRGCGVGLGLRDSGRVPMGTMFSGCEGCAAWEGGVGYMGCAWYWGCISGCGLYPLMSLKEDMSQEMPSPAMEAGMLCDDARAWDSRWVG